MLLEKYNGNILRNAQSMWGFLAFLSVILQKSVVTSAMGRLVDQNLLTIIFHFAQTHCTLRFYT